jgi:DNA-binding transcriptional LysR family regulator
MAYLTNIRMFVRVHELGSMSAAARDRRVSPAVASSRISALEKHLGVRLFNRTTRNLRATEQGLIFYEGAMKVLEAIEEVEARVADVTQDPQGTIHVAAPLGIGKRFISPIVPVFKDTYPRIDVRLRLTDRRVDMSSEGLDVAFFLGTLEDSSLRVRSIAECPRVLCAAPRYIDLRGNPRGGTELLDENHDCLLLKYPGAPEPEWTLITESGPKKFEVSGPFESDDGDVLTGWALDGRGIINKPIFEVTEYLNSGALVPVAIATPPTAVQLACLYPHKRYQDPKIRRFIDFMNDHCRRKLKELANSLSSRRSSCPTSRYPSRFF